MTPEEIMTAIRKLSDEDYKKFVRLFKDDDDICPFCLERGCLPHGHNDE